MHELSGIAIFLGPVALVAVGAAVAGVVMDRRRRRRGQGEALLADAATRGEARSALDYFGKVGDSSNG
jgi:hypothetical protein